MALNLSSHGQQTKDRGEGKGSTPFGVVSLDEGEEEKEEEDDGEEEEEGEGRKEEIHEVRLQMLRR